MKSTLIFAYYSIHDPLFKSAVYPYIKLCTPGVNHRFVLLTFEHKKYVVDSADLSSIEKELASNNIIWYQLKWHSGFLKPFKKVYDLLTSLFFVKTLVRKHKITAIYSEGFPGAIIGHFCSRLYNLSHIIHSFEPHADYMLESGVWSKFSWEYSLLKYFERKVAFGARWILTGTGEMATRIAGWGIDESKIIVVPSCVDTVLFCRDVQYRTSIREMFGFNAQDLVIAYVGKLGGMYWLDEFYELVRNFTYSTHLRFKLLMLTGENHQVVKAALKNVQIDPQDYAILHSAHADVYKYLSAADIGLVAVRQLPSKRFCSPIKTGEYLSCGLPVIIPKGISDDYSRLVNLGLGISLESTNREELARLPEKVAKYFQHFSASDIAESARNYAIEYRGLERHRQTFLRVFGDIDVTVVPQNQNTRKEKR